MLDADNAKPIQLVDRAHDGQPLAIICDAERIAQVRPNDAQAHLFAGVYHLLYRPDFSKARADLERALQLRPGYPEAASFLQLLAEKEGG